MDPTITFEDFEAIAEKMFIGSTLRYGQLWFNLLVELKPDVADKIRGTIHDPFHHENVPEKTSRIAATLWKDIGAHDFVA
jgi:hypothetical protein